MAYLADFQRLVQALRLADYRFVLLFVLISLLWLALRATAWRTLVKESVSWTQVFLTLNQGYLLNNLLPFRLGEVGRAFLLSRKAQLTGTPLTFWQVFSTIIIERSLDVALAAALLLSTLPFVVGVSWAEQAGFAALGLIAILLLSLVLLAYFREQATALFNRLLGRQPTLHRLLGSRLEAFLNGLAVLTEPSRFIKAVGLILLGWLVAVVQYNCLLQAFFPGGQLLWAAFSLGVLALGIAAPSSPGAVGVMELSLIGALAVFGLDASTALALALTAHATNYAVTGLIGAYALLQDGLTLGGLYRTVRNFSEEAPPN